MSENNTSLSPESFAATGTITKIEPVKRRAERFAIFVDDNFAFAVSADTLTQFQLAVGQQLTGRQRAIIEQHETYESAKQAALRYLGLRMRSERELITYLKRKKYAPPIIARVLQYCREHQYLDDLNFAEVFVRDKINLSKDGLLKIKAALIQKGVAAAIVNQVCARFDDSNRQLQRAVDLARKKFKQLQSDPRAREKILNYLQQKGYPLSITLQAIREVVHR